MKKIYLGIIALISLAATSQAQTVPTCSLDPVFVGSNKSGVWPDEVTNFVSGTVGQSYEQNITVKVPLDTVASGIKVCFTRFELKNPTGVTNYNLPSGLNFGNLNTALDNSTVNGAPSYKFPGNSNNCVSIYGTPTAAGTYSLQLEVQAYGNIIGFGTCPASPNVSSGTSLNTTTLNYYVITIAPNTTGIESYEQEGLTVYPNVPNPFSDKTTIKFNTRNEEQANVEVYNTLGKLVYSKNMTTQVGENNVELNTNDWKSGIYIYKIKYKNVVVSKKMMLVGANN